MHTLTFTHPLWSLSFETALRPYREGVVKASTTHIIPQSEVAVPTFDQVYREHRNTLFAVVRSVIGDSDELEDVLQLVFIEIHRCLPRFEARSKLSTWLYRIAVNVALQYLRSKKRKRWLILSKDDTEITYRASESNECARAEDRQLLHAIQNATVVLSEKKRVVWQLHELQGLEPGEIAQILEVPLNTVRSRLLAARKELMDELKRKGIIGPGGQA